MKLYMHPVSITCRPVRLFIAENKIPMDEELVDVMTGAQYKPPYATINPNSLVPMLEDGDLKLTELKCRAGSIGISYDGQSSDTWDNLAQQFESLGCEVRPLVRHPGNVASGPG